MRTLKITTPEFDEGEIRKVRECLDSGWVTQGPLNQRFETAFALRHKVAFAHSATSCTAALHLAALALGVGPGDEVVVPAFTWVTSAHCAEYVGAKVVFADIDPRTYNLSPEAFEAAITSRTKAVVVVHLFGLAAEMGQILDIANRNGVAVIEDAACAVGTLWNGKPVGGLGQLGCFSFHPRKVITTGEGGMVTTNDKTLADMVFSLKNHGTTGHLLHRSRPPRPYEMAPFDNLGYNLRMPDILAAIGLAQLEKLDRLLNERLECARRYDALLADVEEIDLPMAPERCGHTYQSYVVRVAKGGAAARNRLMEYLHDQGIETRPGTHAPHSLGYYRNKYGIRPEAYPHALRASAETITLPIFPGMTEDDQEYISGHIKQGLAM